MSLFLSLDLTFFLFLRKFLSLSSPLCLHSYLSFSFTSPLPSLTLYIFLPLTDVFLLFLPQLTSSTSEYAPRF